MNKLIPLAALSLLALPAAANTKVVMETSMGVIELELEDEKAPKSVENFVKYAEAGAYNGTIFHRVIRDFMVQGGGYDTKLQKRPTQAPIQNEATNRLSNVRGTVAMARTSAPHSATNQFFINVVDNKRLDHRSTDPRGYGYTVFGKVTKGMDVVDKIRAVPTGACQGFRRDCPQTQVIITKVTVTKAAAAAPAKAPAAGGGGGW